MFPPLPSWFLNSVPPRAVISLIPYQGESPEAFSIEEFFRQGHLIDSAPVKNLEVLRCFLTSNTVFECVSLRGCACGVEVMFADGASWLYAITLPTSTNNHLGEFLAPREKIARDKLFPHRIGSNAIRFVKDVPCCRSFDEELSVIRTFASSWLEATLPGRFSCALEFANETY
jgi:hypothetical protein